MSARLRVALAAAAIGAAAIAGCEAGASAPPSDAATAGAATTPVPREGGPDTSLLPAAAGIDVATRIAEDVVPPTNRWYSALAFGEPGLPVFPAPLSFQAVDGGFAVGLTRPTAAENAILAPAMTDVTATVAGASGYGIVTAATPVAVTLETGPVEAILAQGVPAVAVTSDGGAEVTLSVGFVDAGDVATATVGETTYGLAVTGGSVDGTALTLDPGGSAHLFAVPDDGDAEAFAAALGAPPSAADAGFTLGDGTVTTTVTYGDEPTVVAVPSARAEGLDCELGTFATIHGPYAVCASASVAWDAPAIEPSAALDLSGITDAERGAIVDALREDAAAPPALPADTYFGSKALYRIANLIQVADALGEEAIAADLAATLGAQLELWGDPDGCEARAERCFTYDGTMRGVVGLATAFGSEEFNDHHFHYGYLLYAAAVAGARDPDLAERIAPVMNLVAEDFAAPGTSDAFPVRRAFDPVAGHSWASGISPFADGNNQESSSEAVLAWNAVALWADLTGDDALGDSARWMLAAESEAARRLYLAPDLTGLDGYAHRIVAIEWGAKRDYATWFSPDPAAMLGIQIIPAQPAAVAYLGAVEPDHILASVEEAWGPAMPDLFPDYLLMYQALAGDQARADAWTRAIDLPDDAIDDGTTRTWLLAWIAAAG